MFDAGKTMVCSKDEALQISVIMVKNQNLQLQAQIFC